MIVNDQTRWSYFTELKRGNKCSEVPRLFRVWSVLPLAIPGDWDQAGGFFRHRRRKASLRRCVERRHHHVFDGLASCMQRSNPRTDTEDALANPHTCLV